MTIRVANSLIPGKFHLGFRGLGVLGAQIASEGADGPGFGFPSVGPDDNDAELWFQILTLPSGTLAANEDTSFTYTGPSSSFTFKKWRNGVDNGTATATLNVGVAPVPTVTGVTVTPSTASGNTQFSASVLGANNPSQAVTWSMSGGGSINSAGLFTEPAATNVVQTITVTATSVLDPSKSGTATVTIAALPVVTVTSVTVSPASATVEGGATLAFSATVVGQNNPPEGVTWAATLGSIDADGLVTAPAATTSQQIGTVTATSTFNTARSGTASFTVPAIIPEDPDPTPTTRAIRIVLGEAYGPAANLTGVMVSLHAATGPHNTGLALYQSASESTDESGELAFSVATDALAPGASALLSVLMPDGRHYLGLVAVE